MVEHDSRQPRSDRFPADVHRREQRKLSARRHGAAEVWFGLGTFGVVGWAVTVPTLLGIGVGVWLDMTFTGRYSWTLMLMAVGLGAGCANAWFWLQRERSKITQWKERNHD